MDIRIWIEINENKILFYTMDTVENSDFILLHILTQLGESSSEQVSKVNLAK